MKRFGALLLCCAMLLPLCGCGNMFQEEYVVVGDYTPPAAAKEPAEGRFSVSDLSELRRVLLELVSAGIEESSVAFDPDYTGEISEDMASACWQVRTQDALCAYCVENISYDLAKIVNYMEARVTLRYSEAVCPPTEVLRRPYSSGMDELVRAMLAEGRRQEAVLIDRSVYTAEGMEELIAGVYRAEPQLAPKEPGIGVMMLSGSDMQRLYEIDLDYGMDEDERVRRLAELDALDPFAELDAAALDEAHRALAAIEWLSAHCVYDPEGANDLYSALIGGRADEEGMAFALVRLCALLGLECRMVYGQRSWEDYCWNIVRVDGDYYHIDPAACAAGDLDNGFLLRDERMWEQCRWDVSAYPVCGGELSWHALAVQDGLIEEEEEPEEAEEEAETVEESESEDAEPEEDEL